MMKKRIALLALNNPFSTPADGGKRDIKTRMDALSLRDDCLIDLYILKKPEDCCLEIDKDKYHINEVFMYDMMPVSPGMLFSKYPLSIVRRMIPEMEKELSSRSYDAVIYEGEYMALYRLKDICHAKKHILRMHNIESNYRSELVRSSTSVISKAAQLLESMKYRALEKHLCGKFDSFMFISKDEMDDFEKQYPQYAASFYWVPTSADCIAETPAENASKTVLYYGSLDIDNNYRSVRWFAEDVLPKMEDVEGLKLKIAGKISENRKEYLQSLSPKIEVCGYVGDLQAEIASAAMVICPVLFGAGVKVKLIDALAGGQIVYTNSKGTEGTGLESGVHLFVSDDADETSAFCVSVLNSREKYLYMAQNALEYIRNNHSAESQAEVLSRLTE